jgi:hypothetical protein
MTLWLAVIALFTAINLRLITSALLAYSGRFEDFEAPRKRVPSRSS